MTTVAMFIGLIVAHVLQPGAGLNINPNTVVDAFSKGEIPLSRGGKPGWT